MTHFCVNHLPSTTRLVRGSMFAVRLVSIMVAFWLMWPCLVIAQSVAPPPGFSPGSIDEPNDIPATPPRQFKGSSDSDSFGSTLLDHPHVEDGVDNHPYSAFPRRARAYRVRDPVAVFADENPPLPRVWFRAEALLWWSKSSPIPVPLVTVGDPNDTIPGAIGQAGTVVVLGNQNLRLPGQGGERYTLGFALDQEQKWGLEGTYFDLLDVSTSSGVTSSGSMSSALLTFPFFNPNLLGEDSAPIALPGSFAGTAIVSTRSYLQGADVNLIHNQVSSDGFRFDLLGGFRYANLQEGLYFTTDSPDVYTHHPAYFHTYDRFATNNNFYGGQLGVRASYDGSIFFMNATTKLAMGSMFEQVGTNGYTVTNSGGYVSAPGGYLTSPTNLGTASRQQFAFVPELNLNFGIRLRPWASIMVGYSFLYLSSVARPGDQIDRTINPAQSFAISGTTSGAATPPSRPALDVHSTDFWAQGLNFALELRF